MLHQSGVLLVAINNPFPIECKVNAVRKVSKLARKACMYWITATMHAGRTGKGCMQQPEVLKVLWQFVGDPPRCCGVSTQPCLICCLGFAHPDWVDSASAIHSEIGDMIRPEGQLTARCDIVMA